jgi:hypothetical protein
VVLCINQDIYDFILIIGVVRGVGVREQPPFLGKTFEIDRENPGFLRKRSPSKS